MLRRIQLYALAALIGVATIAAGCGDSSDDGGGETSTTTTADTAEIPDVPFKSPESGLPIGYPQKPENAELTIGLLNPRRASESLIVLFDTAKEQITELGGEPVELDAQLDADRQVGQFEQLINRGVDAIGIVPIAEPKLLNPLLAKAEKAGIPVVGLEVTPGKAVQAPGFASQIWQRRDYMTYLKVKAATEALGTGAKVGEIGFAVPVPLFVFTEERTKHWAKEFGLEIIDSAKVTEDTVDSGQEAAVGLVARNPDMVGVIGYNDEPAIGASLAGKAAGRDDLETFGNGAGGLGLSAIENGRLTATVYFDKIAEGEQLAIGLYLAAQEVDVPPVVLAGEPFIVTEANVDEVPR